MRLDNISKHFTISDVKKNSIKRKWIFLVDFNPIDTNDILGIHKYSIKKKHNIKQYLGNWENIYWIINWPS